MKCKFLEHGIAISNDSVVRPCCEWSDDPEWKKNNHISRVNLLDWRQSLSTFRDQLAQGQWPTQCRSCEQAEGANRGSIRGNGESAYANYQPEDITLEIRPGNVCNYACQTCWPSASSRVAQFHHRAGMIDIKSLDTSPIEQFDLLEPIAHRIRDLIILGGEPFYDKNCLKFLHWAVDNLTARIIMFTNGSAIDWDWVDAYPNKIVLVFSIDAIGKPAEYIRVGTDWPVVEQNFLRAQSHPKVEVRVNITASVYNYYYMCDVIDFLIPQWPSVVSIGTPHEPHFREHVIPTDHRDVIIARLEATVKNIQQAKIESGQKAHVTNAVIALISSLQTQPWDKKQYNEFRDFVIKMDRTKRIQINDYCKNVADMLSKQPVEIF